MKKALLFLSLMITFSLCRAQHWTSSQLLPDTADIEYIPSQGVEFGWSMAGTQTVEPTPVPRFIVGSFHDKAVIYYKNTVTGKFDLEGVVQAQPVVPFDGFGVDVDIDGNTAVVGAMNHNGHGAAYVFEYNTTNFTWEFQDKLEPSDGVSNDRFGERLALSGDRIAVGARNHGGTGAVYFFTRTGAIWVEEDKITPAIVNPGDGFGQDVAMHGDTVVATSINHYNGTPGHTGAAWTFKINADTLQELDKLTMESSEWSFSDNFGMTVEMDGKNVLVGAPSSNLSGVEGGAVIPWRREGASFVRRHPIVMETPQAFAGLGGAIGIMPGGDRIVVGAAGAYGNSGVVIEMTFIDEVAIEKSEITSVQPGFQPGFGTSVVLFPRHLVVGANYGSIPGVVDSGSAEYFNDCDEGEVNTNINWTGTWLESQELNGSEYTWYRLNTSGIFSYPEVVGTGMNHMPSGGGTFFLRIEKNGCVVMSTIVISPVGIQEVSENSMVIAPNPAAAFIKVSSSQAINGWATVQDLQGRSIMDFSFKSGDEIDIADLSGGVYVLKIQDQKTKALFVNKFTKTEE